jgi:rubrerythrin
VARVIDFRTRKLLLVTQQPKSELQQQLEATLAEAALAEATLAERMSRGDLRHSHKGVCGSCGHTFWAPVIGNCPRCGAASVAKILSQELDYTRV